MLALGNSSYPKFCAFGKHVDGALAQLGGDRLHALYEADELNGQDQTAREWIQTTYQVT